MAPKVARRAGIAPFYVMEVMKAAATRAAAGGDVLHLEIGQPSTPAPAAVIDTAMAALRLDPLHYTHALGTDELRAAIAHWYRLRYRHDVDAHQVAITSGASGACVLAFLACFDEGDRVAIARPGYPCYRHMLSAFGIDVIDLPVDGASRFQPTPAHLEQAIERHGPLAGLVVASPSNPTGTMLRDDEMAALAACCRAHDMRLVSDEIYHGITYDHPAPTALAHDCDAVVVNSFSKYFSMTGWRLGWLVLPDDLVEPVERLAQNLTVAPPTLAQRAALGAFAPDGIAELDGHVARYGRNRDVVRRGLEAAGFDRVAPSDGAFYLWVDLRGHPRVGTEPDSEALAAEWLADLGVAATPGIDFDPVAGSAFLRLSFAGAEADMSDAVSRIVAWAR
jgi:aspartate/methionine/tyrosine aminotransferase